ncbi:MAG TPA: sulfurtransferase TusA family protein [Caulobacteraceae bacterium]
MGISSDTGAERVDSEGVAVEALVIDARGHRCPVPTLRLRRALESAKLVRLLADDPMAKIDVPHFASETGHQLVEASEEGGWLSFLVRRR